MNFQCIHRLTLLSISSFLSLISISTFAQDTTATQSGSYFIQLATTGLSTSNRTAFWLQSNQYGIIPSTPQPLLASAGVYYNVPLSERKNRWAIDGAVEGILQTQNPEVKGVLGVGYLRIKYKKWELYGGRKREYFGLSDTLLGMGSLTFSPNALPLPQVRIGTADFVKLPLVGKWLKAKAYFSHGWFERNRPFVDNSYLHQKGLYMRLGGDKWPIMLHGGFNHSVQWGGYAEAFKDDPNAMSRYGYYENSWFGYWGVVSGMSMAHHSDRVIIFDQNRVGNHVGTVEMGLQIKTNPFDVFLYRQSMFEDGTLFYRLQAADSFNGLRWLNKVKPLGDFYLHRVTLEFLSTIDQGGDKFIDTDPYQRGRDNYFNHSQYQDGWSYRGRSLGTPFIPVDAELKEGVRKNVIAFTNNRVEVLHAGFSGKFKKRTTWELKASYSKNYGTYDGPYVNGPLKQFSGILRIGTRLKWLDGSEISGAVAYDGGEIYDRTIGGYLSIRKIGIL